MEICPVTCRSCGALLKVECQFYTGKLFRNNQGSLTAERRKVLVCEKMRWYSWWHDRREFSDDCEIEYELSAFGKRRINVIQ